MSSSGALEKFHVFFICQILIYFYFSFVFSVVLIGFFFLSDQVICTYSGMSGGICSFIFWRLIHWDPTDKVFLRCFISFFEKRKKTWLWFIWNWTLVFFWFCLFQWIQHKQKRRRLWFDFVIASFFESFKGYVPIASEEKVVLSFCWSHGH